MRKTSILLSALAASAFFTAPAMAQSKGDWTLGVGVGSVQPKSNNGKLAGGTLPVSVHSDTQPIITGEYFVADNVGIELLGSLPYRHNIDISGLGRVGSTKHLPPTLSVQYHFNSDGQVSPLLGIGVNYTTFFSERTKGALAGDSLRLRDSWGVALHAGLDFKISDKGAIRVDARWIDLSSKVKLNGESIGKVKINPAVYGVTYVHAF